jgi:deoxycytidylate deaminase
MTEGFVPPVPSDRPELFFALVGATGTDLDHITSKLAAELGIVGYELVDPIRLSHLIHGLKSYEHLRGLAIPEDERIREYMNAGDDIRKELGHGAALAALAVEEVCRRRGSDEPRTATAFLFRSLKHPKEVELLRGIYGSSLVVISAYESQDKREQQLARKIKRSREQHLERGLEPSWGPSDDAHEAAMKLLERDQEDDEDLEFGQSVRKTFPLADFFLDLTRDVKGQLERLVQILFNHPHMSPSRDEYAMFMAQAASLRSADMSRQVGAVIVDEDGEVVATGCNEVPKPGGGIYWSGDDPDYRDCKQGSDPNALMGREVLQEVFKSLRAAGWLSETATGRDANALVADAQRMGLFERARVGNLIEFGRVVHAEMNALVHAARLGLGVRGRSLYCTTFPCHGCARHIIGAGIAQVVYIEPYPKSLAIELYPEAIGLGTADGKRVAFTAFTGVAPRRYLEFFGFGRRKDPHGYAVDWRPKEAHPRIRPLGSPWLFAERHLCGSLLKALEDRAWI